MKIIINFRTHEQPAEAEPYEGGFYAVGEHFGMMVYNDQQEGHPDFDSESPLTWRKAS